tara:strand:+ start:783 stop:1733 length:951 start_codon:yes stop_codon:yes gene_type:complete
MLYLFLISLLPFVNCFTINNVNVYKREYNKKVIKVYEPKDLEKKDMDALILFTGANSLMPADIYSNFISYLNVYNFSVNVVNNDNMITSELLYDIRDEYREIIPISHSSGYVNIMETISRQKNIKKAVFLDPVDNSDIVNNNLFNYIDNKKANDNYLEDVLILNAEKSYKGSIFPKINIPFIPAFALDVQKFKKRNPNINVEKIKAEDYGHTDVLDLLWSDLMHSTISKGNDNRDKENLDSYHDWLASKIYNFINIENEYDKVEYVKIKKYKDDYDKDDYDKDDYDKDDYDTINIDKKSKLEDIIDLIKPSDVMDL